MSSVQAGRVGEAAAIEFLHKKGYKVLSKNFRSRFGEIDIVAQFKNVLVFVEVKTRWSKKFGYPEEAVTPSKVRSIIKTGDYFKLLNLGTPGLMRVDVIAIEVEGDEVVEIRHIENVTG